MPATGESTLLLQIPGPVVGTCRSDRDIERRNETERQTETERIYSSTSNPGTSGQNLQVRQRDRDIKRRNETERQTQTEIIYSSTSNLWTSGQNLQVRQRDRDIERWSKIERQRELTLLLQIQGPVVRTCRSDRETERDRVRWRETERKIYAERDRETERIYSSMSNLGSSGQNL